MSDPQVVYMVANAEDVVLTWQHGFCHLDDCGPSEVVVLTSIVAARRIARRYGAVPIMAWPVWPEPVELEQGDLLRSA